MSVLDNLSPDHTALLEPLFVKLEEPAETVIFEQGSLADRLYIVLAGEIKICYKPEDGPEIVVSRVRQEGVIGWSALLGNPFYSSTAISETECRLLSMRGADLRRLCEYHPETGAVLLDRLAGAISERLNSTHQQVIALLEQGLCININTVMAG